MNSISRKAEYLSSPFLILFAFALPFSTSAGSITAMLVLLAWMLSGNFKGKFNEIKNNPVAIAVLCYIALHIIGLLWSEDIAWGLHILKQQWKLLMLPIFITIVRREHVNYYMAAFVGAIALKATKAYLVWLGFISLPPGSIFTTVGTSHVIYNPMLALAIYIVLQNMLFSKNSKQALFFKGILLLYLSCNMFITVGRTGQVAFFVLLIVALFQFFFDRSKRKLLVGLMLLPFFFFAIYQFSQTFRDRIHTAVSEIQTFDNQEVTSLGCRVWFYQNSLKLIQQNKLIGTGTGDFPMEYARINQIYSPNLPIADNPHNQYLMITGQFGFIGLLILLGIFFSQIVIGQKQTDRLTQLRQAFPIFFMVIMLAESYLQVHGTGLLFSLFSSFLYKDFPKIS